jgi:hypothetical protein
MGVSSETSSGPNPVRAGRAHRRWFPWCLAAAAVLGNPGLAPGGDQGATETLDRALLKQAPVVMRYLRERRIRNVGVLKFRVKQGDDPASDRAGLLNLNLAARLETALILADDPSDPIGVIHNASEVAASLPGANHLTAEGRKALFRGRYPLAWGDRKVTADAFVTGVVSIDAGLRRIAVSIQAFDTRGGALKEVARIDASPDPPALTEVGESFLIRGAFDEGRVVEKAEGVRSSRVKNPLEDPEAPVALEVYYDHRRVGLECVAGRALAPEPSQGQKITFVLRKTARDRGRYGIVLMVNGESTLFRERLAPFLCHKWVLGPDTPVITVPGYQVDDRTSAAFRVLSAKESREDAINYGPETGMLNLVVFREEGGEGAPLPLDDEAEDVAAVSRGAPPGRSAETLPALMFQLREGAPGAGDRGLIVQGAATSAAIRRVEFRPHPTPVMSAAITYYHVDREAPKSPQRR